MEGDSINCINVKPKDPRFIFVHARDNCIREIQTNNQHVRKYDKKKSQWTPHARYFGALSSKYLIKSCLSPDGTYLLAGSESGQPVIWDTALNKCLRDEIDRLEVNFKMPVTDVAWNDKYQMIAVCGFGAELPILIYCWESKHL